MMHEENPGRFSWLLKISRDSEIFLKSSLVKISGKDCAFKFILKQMEIVK